MKREDFINKTTPIYVCILLILIALVIRNGYLLKDYIKEFDKNFENSYLYISSSKEIDFNDDNIKSYERIVQDGFYDYFVDDNLTDDEVIIYGYEGMESKIGDKVTFENSHNVEFTIKDFYTEPRYVYVNYISKEMFEKMVQPGKYEYAVRLYSWYEAQFNDKKYADGKDNYVLFIGNDKTFDETYADFIMSSNIFLFIVMALDIVIFIINAIRHKKARIEEGF